jgi:hypothetical protein
MSPEIIDMPISGAFKPHFCFKEIPSKAKDYLRVGVNDANESFLRSLL